MFMQAIFNEIDTLFFQLYQNLTDDFHLIHLFLCQVVEKQFDEHSLTVTVTNLYETFFCLGPFHILLVISKRII